MKFTKEEVVPMWIQAWCDQDGCDGEMILSGLPEGGIHSSNGYPHKCDKCGREELIEQHFPRVAHEKPGDNK